MAPGTKLMAVRNKTIDHMIYYKMYTSQIVSPYPLFLFLVTPRCNQRAALLLYTNKRLIHVIYIRYATYFMTLIIITINHEV